MQMMGASELLVIIATLFGGGVGVPISLPPAAPDALLDKLSPERPVFYSNWSGVGEIKAGSANQTEALLAEPEVQEFIKKAEAMARMALVEAGRNDEGAQMASQIVPPLVRAALLRPAMLYLRDLEVTPDGPPKFKGAFVMNLGPSYAEISRILKMIPAEASEKVTIDGVEFQKIQPPAPGSPAITIGTKGAYLIVTVGDNEADALLARAKKAAPGWIADLRSRFPVDRVATITKIDLGGVIDVAAPLGGPQAMQMLEATGLSGLKDYVAVTGLDKEGFAQFVALDVEGERKGLLALDSDSPLTKNDLSPIPLGSLLGIAAKMDAGKVYDGVMDLVGNINPQAVGQVTQATQQIEQVLGMQLRQDIMAALGDVWTLHTHEDDGGLISGWTVTVSVKDAGKLGSLSQRVLQLAAQASRSERDPKIEWSQYRGKSLFTFNVPDEEMPFAPTWCVTEDHLVIGLYPQAIKSFLIRQASEKNASIADHEKVAAMLDTKAQSITAVDNRRFAQLLYPLGQLGMRMMTGAAQKEGVPLDFTALPSLTSISPHLGVGVTASRTTDQGFEMEQHQALPGGNGAATAPVAIALLLPAVQSARQSARRMQSMNNMKQIALAFHNYADTYRSFPPRFNTDKEGKPLLSWRVYLLPYMEQQALYERFRLDEPWDSEHNKKLIPLMPKVYASPSSPQMPGKTTYLAIASDKAMMIGPKDLDRGKERPRTTWFADVTDGTSNTVFCVEANFGSSVTWTKPDDYEAPAEDPAKGLRGVYPRVILMSMGDGSVQAYRDSLRPADFKALFTRNGGEVLNLDRLR